MDWTEVKSVFPNQIVLIEVLKIEVIGTIRKILNMSVISTHEDSSLAWKAYKSLHTQYPQREFYIFHTDRENIDVIDENEVRKNRKAIKLTKEIPSYARAIDISETHQQVEDQKEMKEKLLEYYRSGTMEELHSILPFPKNFYWKFAEVVEMFEFGRISNELLSRGYSSDELYNLFPVQDTDNMIKYYQKYGSIEIEQIFEALTEIYKEKDRIGTIKRLGNSPALLKEMSSIIKSIFPEDQNELEKINISELTDTEIKNNNTLGGYTDEVLSIIKFALSGENSQDIAAKLNLSNKYVEKTIAALVKGTTLEELKEQYANYRKEETE